jgi:hypothetical protein
MARSERVNETAPAATKPRCRRSLGGRFAVQFFELSLMADAAKIHWLRAVAGGVLAEACVFAIVFPTLYLLGQTAFLVSILLASALMPLVFAIWVCRRVTSHFLLHGALVGIVAAIVYLIIAHGQPEPLLYKIAHGLKVVGGIAGGWIAALGRLRASTASPN